MNITSLLTRFSQIKSSPQRRKEGQKIAKGLSVEELKKLIKELERKNTTVAWGLIAHLITEKLYERYPDFALDLIQKLAEHEDWEIREEAATVLKRLKKKYFDELYPVLEAWAKGENAFLKRAICVALIQTFKQEKENLDKIFYLFEQIITCNDPYVKKNCGPFGLAHVFRRYPEETEAKLYEWLDKYANNPTAIWNIITVFSQANAKYFPEVGKRVLTKVEESGLIERYPKLKRIFESVKIKNGG